MPKLLAGKAQAEKVLGKQRIKDALCMRKYPGDKRRKPRSDWWPYVYEKGGEWYVTSEDKDKLAKSARWTALHGAYRADAYIDMLNSGELPFTSPNPVDRANDWSYKRAPIIALDIEGTDTIDRISIATGTQSGSWQWSHKVKVLIQAMVDQADTILGWSFDYDTIRLRKFGVKIPQEKCLDLMYAHQTLNPWRNNGLGKAAPLYVMMEPWKHLDNSDPEKYSMIDASVLHPTYHTIKLALQSRKQWDHYTKLDVPFLNRLREMEQHPIKLRGGTSLRLRYQHRLNGQLTEEIAAAFLTESKPRIPNPKDIEGHLYTLSSELAVELLTGEKLDPQPEAIRRHLLGYGFVSARRGKPDRAEEPLDISAKDYKALVRLFDKAHPSIVAHRQQVQHLYKRERFVTNPFGRRCYGAKEPLRWLIESTVSDILKHVVANGPLPVYIDHYNVVYSDPVDFPSLISNAMGA